MNNRIFYIQYTNPAGYPALEHSSSILASQGWEIFFFGTGAYGANMLEFSERPNVTVRKIKFCPGGLRQKFHYAWFCFLIIGQALRYQPRWVYASDILSCPTALLLSYIPGIKVIYHEHDSPHGQSKNLFMRFCLWARSKLIKKSQATIFPNEKRISLVMKEMDRPATKKTLCVWNCPRLEEAAQPHSQGIKNNFLIHYHGSITPERLPIAVIKALSFLPESIGLYIAGYETIGSKGYINVLVDVARKTRISKRLYICETMSLRSVLLAQCRKADVGLVLMPKNSQDINFRYMIGASNKLFDYLACGLALLVSNLPDWEEMYVKPGYGLSCEPDDPKSIASAISWFMEHPEETFAMGDRGRQRILKEWNYEKMFDPVLKLLQK